MTLAQALWYLTRGTGLVCLVGLSAVMVLGLAVTARTTTGRNPLFVLTGLHRNLTVLTLVVLAGHIAAAVLDGYAPIGWLDAVLPFHSPYRRLWLGLGTGATDLLVVLTVSSLLRARSGYRTWRVLHAAAYAAWPVAVLHGLGTGSDSKATWVLALTGGCVAAVLVALLARLLRDRRAAAAPRWLAGAAALAAVAALVVWTVSGPLRADWARRAGTPADLIGGRHPAGVSGPR